MPEILEAWTPGQFAGFLTLFCESLVASALVNHIELKVTGSTRSLFERGLLFQAVESGAVYACR
jgi:hypothetical protein